MTEGTAAGTLDAIRNGANALVILAHQRLTAALIELSNGDFPMALQCVNEAQAKLETLEAATQHLAVFEGTVVVRACDLRTGDRLPVWGVLGGVEETTEGGVAQIAVRIEDGSVVQLAPEQEVLAYV